MRNVLCVLSVAVAVLLVASILSAPARAGCPDGGCAVVAATDDGTTTETKTVVTTTTKDAKGRILHRSETTDVQTVDPITTHQATSLALAKGRPVLNLLHRVGARAKHAAGRAVALPARIVGRVFGRR